MTSIRRLWLTSLLLLLPTLAAAQSYTISPPPFLLAQNNSGAIINNSCIWTYAAGTTTAATTYSDNIGTPNTNPIRSDSAGRFTAFLSPGSSYKFVYESACTPPAHGTTLRTADNISAIPASAASVDITGTAGESITAGQAVYLSNGDGGKTPGQWYKADSTNTYSSTVYWVGIATVNIASGSAGTIRRAGAVSGLTGLATGTIYYVGAAGALTSTAPTNARKLGQADSTTSIVLGDPPPFTGGTLGQVVVAQGSGIPPFFQAQGFFNDFRLSLTTATCETSTDVTAATTLFLTPCTGNRITLFNSAGAPETCTTAEVSIAVPATTSQMYDVWAYDSTFGSCTVTLELLAWTSDTARATAIARTNGRWTKTGDATRMLVGSFRTTIVSGQTEDSVTKRYVGNVYNRARRALLKQEATATWTYSTATLRQANGAAANQVDVVVSVAEAAISLTVEGLAKNDTGGVNLSVAVGEDSTSAKAAEVLGGTCVVIAANNYCNPIAFFTKKPAVGRHTYVWLEYSTTTGVSTWSGAAVGGGGAYGVNGWIEN